MPISFQICRKHNPPHILFDDSQHSTVIAIFDTICTKAQSIKKGILRKGRRIYFTEILNARINTVPSMDSSRVLYTWFLSEQLEWLLCIMLTKDKTENTEQVSSDFPE